MFGIFPIFKPRGITSRDCVNRIQKLFRPLKVGHAGTLDPIAEGVLLVAVGQAVRLTELLQELPKRYRGRFHLGCWSPSDDTETEPTWLTEPHVPSLAELQLAAHRFVGRIKQRPPAYSAIKINGKRAYEKARKGEQFEVPEREVRIHSIEVVESSDHDFLIDVHCDGGTYIRTLGKDIAQACGTDALMSELTRVAVGSCSVQSSIPLEDLTTKEEAIRRLVNPAPLLPRNRVLLTEEEATNVRNGVYIPLSAQRISDNDGMRFENHQELIAIDASGQLRSIMTAREANMWGGRLNFDGAVG